MTSLLSLYGGPSGFVDADSDGMIFDKGKMSLVRSKVQTLCEQQWGRQVNEAGGKLNC